jgi:hypothetical protein
VSARARPPTTTVAQARVIDEVLAWGQPRPIPPVELVEALHQRLDTAIAAGLDEPHRPRPGRRVLFVRALVAGGTWPPAGPLVHDRATVRGILLGRSFARDVERQHVGPTRAVVAAVADELAAERPADPASPSAWWNASPPSQRAGLLDEIDDVLGDARILWPPLPREHLDVSVRPHLRVAVGGGPVLLSARPDLVLDSPHRDDRARALVIVTRTGMPRPLQDRALARATAVVHTLSTGRPPFRWVVLHLTDGRFEVEEFDPQVLADTAESIGAEAARSLASTDRAGASGNCHDAGDEHDGAQA